jgi:hypothetical protein
MAATVLREAFAVSLMVSLAVMALVEAVERHLHDQSPPTCADVHTGCQVPYPRQIRACWGRSLASGVFC